jgi:hypothetical protein
MVFTVAAILRADAEAGAWWSTHSSHWRLEVEAQAAQGLGDEAPVLELVFESGMVAPVAFSVTHDLAFLVDLLAEGLGTIEGLASE